MTRKQLIISVVAVAPLVLLLGYEFEFGDWQFWAFLLAAIWYRTLGPMAEEMHA